MVDELLSMQPDDPDDMPGAETLSELDEALNQTRLEALGGDAGARETLRNVRAMIDEAALRDEIHAGILIVLGRLFAGAEIDIGEAARAAMERVVEATFGEPGEDAFRSIVRPALSTDEGPFVFYKEMDAFIAIYPLRYTVSFVERLAGDASALGRQTAVGFLLHRDEPLAQAAIRGLASAAPPVALDHKSDRWIETIRPWLTPARRRAIDAALPSVGRAAPRAVANAVRATASVCDGSGASTVSLTVRSGSRYTIAAIMIKPTGVTDSILLEGLSRSEAAAYERAACSSAPTSEVSLATATRLLQLALGRNLASDAPPPFALVRALETVGLDLLVPDPATPVEIIAAALSEAPERDRAEIIRDAHESVGDSEVAQSWFEAGDDVDAILETTDSVDQGGRALLKDYLPGRRAFWASQCARSALVLKDGAAPGDDAWRRFALVGRDILRDVPLHEIPLMRQVAEKTAVSYFMQR